MAHDKQVEGSTLMFDNIRIGQVLFQLAKEHKARCNNPDCDISIYEVRGMIKSLMGYPHYEKYLEELGL